MSSKKQHSNKHEVRNFVNTAEVRAIGDGKERKIGGLAIPYDKPAQIGGTGPEGFTEFVRHGAVRDLSKIVMLWQHDSTQPLASVRGKTMSIKDTPIGVVFEATLADSPLGQTAYEAIRRGDCSQVSFGFQTRKDSWQQDPASGNLVRYLEDIDVAEISPVTWGAYSDATHVDARAIRAKLEHDARGVFSTGAIDDDSDDTDDLSPECDPESDLFDPEAECEDEDEDRSEVDVCSACGRPFDGYDSAEELERKAHMDLLLRRLR